MFSDVYDLLDIGNKNLGIITKHEMFTLSKVTSKSQQRQFISFDFMNKEFVFRLI